MNAQKIIAMTAAVLFTSLSLGTIYSGTLVSPASEINGIHVVNLAPVNVTPSATEMRQALLGDASIVAASALIGLTGRPSGSLLGEQLAMPYYSFGNKIGRISKE